MAIYFKQITWKNFLSTGNAGTTLQLDKNKTTLIQGASGAGKSTVIDALCFALYGKPFRNINKPGLVNSVNGKQLEVEVEFETNGKNYRVIRGIKPSRFDIVVDGKLLNQDAATRDYQRVLEQQILMMTYKTFTQIVILGSTSFTPFMQLPASARREVVEDILDIGIFSTMNLLLKQQIQETKDQQTENDNEIKTLKTKAEGLKRLIDTLEEKKDQRLAEVVAEMQSIDKAIDEKEKHISETNISISELSVKISESKSLLAEKNNLSNTVSTGEYEIGKQEDKIRFFHDKNQCPTCNQLITDEYKQSMVGIIESELGRIKIATVDSRNKLVDLTNRLESLRVIANEITSKTHELKSLEAKLESLVERKIELSEIILRLQITESSDSTSNPKSELREIAKIVLQLIEKKKELANQRKLQESASVLLKDNGIKSSIIKEYLPLINKLLNLYLSELQMDVQFSLDEQFNEIVKSRYRDEFQYGNFSEGEKLRLDIAILLVWRHIAKVKNSANTNLLIIDEVLSGRLDPTNQDIVVDMINRLSDEGTNIFVIAHQDGLVDKFRSNVRFEKRGNFSVLV